jgi:multicomponent Na+:H+ antiporter subunit D
VVGSVILLAGFPVFFWVKPIVAEAPPLASVFVFGVFQSVIMVFIFKLFLATPGLEANDTFASMLYHSGAGTVIVAGLLAFIARSLVSLLGYCLLFDMGMTVVAVAIGGTNGWEVAVALQIARYVSLLLAAVGMSILRRHDGANADADGQGLARRAPLGTTLFIFGCASLLGLPMTVGFSSRWALLAASEASHGPPWLSYLILLAMMGGSFGLLGSLIRMLRRTKYVTIASEMGHRWRDGLSAVMLLAGIWLALFPQAAYRYVLRLAPLLQN